MDLACIFDWDGVVIDSSEHHIEGWRRIAKEDGYVFPEHLFKQSFGMKNQEIIPQLWKWTTDPAEIKRIDKKKEAMYRDIMCEMGIIPLPGIENLLKLLNDNNIPCAIGSSAPTANVTTGLDLLGFHNYFKAVVTGEDVTLGKPDPQIFLTAAKKLGALPSQCVVFEDAKVGIAAAHAGKMKVVAVTNTYPAHELSHADWVVASLEEVGVERIRDLLGKK